MPGISFQILYMTITMIISVIFTLIILYYTLKIVGDNHIYEIHSQKVNNYNELLNYQLQLNNSLSFVSLKPNTTNSYELAR